MKANWPFVAIVAGSVLFGVAGGAMADGSRDWHDRGDHGFQAVEQHAGWVRSGDAREADRRGERFRTEDLRRGRDERWQPACEPSRALSQPFAYIRAADRDQHCR